MKAFCPIGSPKTLSSTIIPHCELFINSGLNMLKLLACSQLAGNIFHSYIFSDTQQSVKFVFISTSMSAAINLSAINYDDKCVFFVFDRGALKWWAEVLDVLIGTSDAIHSWREALSGAADKGQWLLNKCGLWGCLLGGVVASNIAQWVFFFFPGLSRHLGSPV